MRGPCKSSSRGRRTFLAVSNETVFSFTVHDIPDIVHRIVRGKGLSSNSLGGVLTRRTGIHLLRTVDGGIGLPFSLFTAGVTRANGASTTDVPVLLSRLIRAGRVRLNAGSGILVAKFNNNLA